MINSNEINSEVMRKVVATAFSAIEAKTSGKDFERWTNALLRAGEEVERNPRWYFECGKLTILSESGKTYEVASDGYHQGCPAYDNHQPCKHRAMRRLLDLYNLAMALPVLNVREVVSPTSHAPALKDSPAKAFLDREVKQLAKADIDEAYRHPSNSLGETFGGVQI